MLRRAGALVVTSLGLTALLAACGDESAPETWRLVTFEVAGDLRPIDEPLFLEVDGDGFAAETPCNTVRGEFGGPLASTAMACDPGRTESEALMTQAFADEPVEIDGRLVFVEGDVRLIYESFVEPVTFDLIAVLGDERRSVDASALPPESATGTVPPDYDALIPVASPVPTIDLFLASLDGRPCVVYGTETSIGSACTGPRELSFRTRTVNVPQDDPSYLRVAIIPDDFGAVADRSGLGTYDTNLLIVADAVPAGTQVLTNTAGNTLAVMIGEPSAQPPTSSVPTTAP
jgi:hypothetical protein